jgi:menaquinone-dependent protoporphyrinogen oxidase
MAAALRDSGRTVDLQPIRDVRTLSGYSAVVLGAPLYMFRWHKDARRFLSRYHQALTQPPAGNLPVAVFAVGPVTPGAEKEWQDARAQLDKELAGFPWFKPAAISIFGGKLDPTGMRFPYTLFMRQVPASDARDWEAVRAWASDLAEKL